MLERVVAGDFEGLVEGSNLDRTAEQAGAGGDGGREEGGREEGEELHGVVAIGSSSLVSRSLLGRWLLPDARAVAAWRSVVRCGAAWSRHRLPTRLPACVEDKVPEANAGRNCAVEDEFPKVNWETLTTACIRFTVPSIASTPPCSIPADSLVHTYLIALPPSYGFGRSACASWSAQ